MYHELQRFVKATITDSSKGDERRRRAFQAIRVGDLHKIFAHRYGGGKTYQLPDDDSGRDDLAVLCDHYGRDNPLLMPKVIAARAPWLIGTELEDFKNKGWKSPRLWKAQQLGEHLNLAEADRQMLGIRTIGTIDMTSEERKQARKLRHRAKMRAARAAKGAVSRQQYLASAKSRVKPWEAEAVSRATWYRRHGPVPTFNAAHGPVSPAGIDETSPCAMNLLDDCSRTCLTTTVPPSAVVPPPSSAGALRAPNAFPMPIVGDAVREYVEMYGRETKAGITIELGRLIRTASMNGDAIINLSDLIDDGYLLIVDEAGNANENGGYLAVTAKGERSEHWPSYVEIWPPEEAFAENELVDLYPSTDDEDEVAAPDAERWSVIHNLITGDHAGRDSQGRSFMTVGAIVHLTRNDEHFDEAITGNEVQRYVRLGLLVRKGQRVYISKSGADEYDRHQPFYQAPALAA